LYLLLIINRGLNWFSVWSGAQVIRAKGHHTRLAFTLQLD